MKKKHNENSVNAGSSELPKNGNSRRRFSIACAASLCLPWSVTQGGAAKGSAAKGGTANDGAKKVVYPDRTLSLHNVHTGEQENITFWSNGNYLEAGLNQISWLMRDFRTGDVKAIDPRLLNVLYLLRRKVEHERPVLILSGFRSKKTNDMLRKTTEGVARRSYHMAGRAVDIRMERVASADIQKAALRLGGGGVGYYPNSNFVHLDTGPVRTW